ncbi:MAG: hypothetical protein ACRDQU_07550 [Pseudonocardiaceae bacterium]
MPARMAGEVLADPIGVIVDLVAAREPALDRAIIEATVTSIAGGRAKRRGLAQALLERPAVLADGRSPAPRGIGDLLIALCEAGATKISPPVCADCGKPLRTLQRRSQDWYCTVCGPRPKRCAGCGHERKVITVDRRGQPRCGQCPDDDDRDPAVVLAEVITRLDPSLSSDVVGAVARGLFSRPSKLRRLAWVIEDNPNLLTGDGAQAPAPGVLRLIDRLRDAGARAIAPPACPRCGRVIALHRRIGGQWLCRNCVAKSRAQSCSRCGAIREAATRDEHGQPLCPNCLITDPANQETCPACGRRRPVSVRSADGPICGSCVPPKTLTCAICGKQAPCVISQATCKPWCQACRQRWIRCSGCGQDAPIRGGTLDEPLCATCTRPDADFWRSCPNCGQPGRIHAGRCARCTLEQRLRELVSDDTGEVRPELQALYDALAGARRPDTVAAWLDKSAAPAILRELTGQPLAHSSLDALPAGKTIEHLRSILVAIGTLPPRDEQMARLERWIVGVVADRPDPDERQMLHRYTVWHVLRRLRGRLKGADTTHEQVVAAQRIIKAAVNLLDWLTNQQLTLATAGQGDLEAWLVAAKPSYRIDAGNFVRWAKKHKLTQLEFPATRWSGPSGVIDTETRWEQARWLLHDTTLKPEDRVAGLLVLLYAQWPTTLSRLTLDHVRTSDDQVSIRLGDEPVVLPEPLAELIRQVVTSRRGKAVIGDQGSSPWLFPGGQPGRPISAFGLAERLRQLGINSARSRSTALSQLATEPPAAILARMLGIHIAVATTRQRASSDDWTDYAAEVSRRSSQ